MPLSVQPSVSPRRDNYSAVAQPQLHKRIRSRRCQVSRTLGNTGQQFHITTCCSFVFRCVAHGTGKIMCAGQEHFGSSGWWAAAQYDKGPQGWGPSVLVISPQESLFFVWGRARRNRERNVNLDLHPRQESVKPHQSTTILELIKIELTLFHEKKIDTNMRSIETC